MRLLDLNPHWTCEWTPSGAPKRHGQGVIFDCPHCVALGIASSDPRMVRLPVPFQNPIDGGAPMASKAVGPLWQRTGETFETLTLSPSVDASKTHPGGWHGYVRNGEIQ